MPLSDIFIIGGGICGMASAIALSKALHQKKDVKITVFELRDEPSALGGAVGLTPSAMRHLDHIGVLRSLNERKLGTEVEKIEIFSTHSGSNLMNLDFVDGQGKGIGGYKGRRVMRRDLLLAMTDAARDMPNVTLEYGKKVAAMENSERSQKVKVLFEGGANREADLVLGCDGIHSNTRMKFVEPERVPVYTGICTAQGYARTSDVHSEIHFKDTGLNMSRRGSLLTTYYTRERDEIYLAAVMEVSETLSRDGWKAKGEDQEGTKRDMMDRFGAEMIPAVRDMIAGSGEWFFYPVYKLENGGKWHRDSVMLLGDAAHAVRKSCFFY
jgi:2-polyprenyl-6-methoxyphenol hydroxylase-like FAD-dependent oxidoreductase